MINIDIQNEDFNLGEEYQLLAQDRCSGAIVTFVGLVREFNENPNTTMWLEHYPGMTEKCLFTIAEKASCRWSLKAIRIIHRIGHLQPGEQIVFVGVSSAHRKSAFESCEFIMDHLKTEAPFWKKEGAEWVAAKSSDAEQLTKWNARNPIDSISK